MKHVAIADSLRNFHLFEGMSLDEINLMATKMECKTRPKHEKLYQTEDPSDRVYFLLKGLVKTYTISSDGREVIKTILHPYSMFGELGLVGERLRHESAVTLNEEVVYCSITVLEFQRLMRSNHFLCLRVLQMVGSRLLKAEEKLEALIFKDARSRIIDFLKENANMRGRQVGLERLFKHCLTQQDIANLTGTSRQTVTSVLNDLRKENLIYFTRNTILIRDMGRLS